MTALAAFVRAEAALDVIHGEPTLFLPRAKGSIVAPDPNRQAVTLVGVVTENGDVDKTASGRGPDANRADLFIPGMSVSYRTALFASPGDQPLQNDRIQLTARPAQPTYEIASQAVPDGETRIVFKLVKV